MPVNNKQNLIDKTRLNTDKDSLDSPYIFIINSFW